MTLRYGKCEGGPCDGRMIAHHSRGYMLAYERDRPMRAVPGKLLLVDNFEKAMYRIGTYLFNPLTQKWHWFADAEALPPYDLWIKEPPEDVPTGV